MIPLVCLIALLSMLSCSTVKDRYPPVIAFINPSENASFYLPDTIVVTAEVSDDEALRVVRLMLVDNNGVPRSKTLTYFPSGREFNFTAEIPVTDPQIESGNYSILISADDGYYVKNQYRGVSLSEMELDVTGYIAVTGNMDFRSEITFLDASFETDTMFEIAQTYRLSGVSGSGELFCYGSAAGLTAYYIPGFEIAWDVPGTPPQPWFSALFTDRQLVFATGTGDAGVLDEAGKVVMRTEVFPDAWIRHLAADEEFIYSWLVSVSGAVKELVVFHRGTGGLLLRERMNADVVALLPDAGKALILANSENDAVISEFDPETLEETWLKNLPGKKLTGGVSLGAGQFLVITEDDVWLYERYYGMISLFAGNPYRFARYDPVNEQILLARERAVDVFGLESGSILRTLDFEESLKDFHVLIGARNDE